MRTTSVLALPQILLWLAVEAWTSNLVLVSFGRRCHANFYLCIPFQCFLCLELSRKFYVYTLPARHMHFMNTTCNLSLLKKTLQTGRKRFVLLPPTSQRAPAAGPSAAALLSGAGAWTCQPHWSH
jgi:hypothetical protein